MRIEEGRLKKTRVGRKEEEGKEKGNDKTRKRK